MIKQLKGTLVFALALALTCTSCKTAWQKADAKFSDEDRTFMVETYTKFVESIPLHSLPLTINCKTDMKITDQELYATFAPFHPAGYEIIGRIPSTDNFNLVLLRDKDSTSAPTLWVTSKLGSNIQFIPLTGLKCESDSMEKRTFTTTICANRDIKIQEWKLAHDNSTVTMHFDKYKFHKTKGFQKMALHDTDVDKVLNCK